MGKEEASIYDYDGRFVVYRQIAILLLVVALFALGFALFSYAVWELLTWYIAPGTPEASERRNVVQAVGQVLGGILAPLLGAAFVFLGYYFGNRAFQFSQRNAEVNHRNSQRQLELEQERQFADLIVKAVEQLGGPPRGEVEKGTGGSLVTRLGGVYTLEHVGQISPR